MRTPLYLATALLLRVCGADLSTDALVAHHGGVVVPLETHAVEVVARSDGDVEAWVVDAEAVAVPSQNLVVVVPGPAPQEVTLAWDPGSASYKGRAPEPVVEGAVEVRLVIDGAPRIARADHIIIAAPAAPVVVAAPPSVTATVEVAAPRPSVRVEAPRGPEVVVVEPARPTVVVAPPMPPGVVVVGPRAPTVVVAPPRPPSVVVVPPRPPGVVVVPPHPPGVRVEVEHGHHGHGRGHDIGRGRGHDRHH